MIIPDLNLLIYAYDSASPDHPKAAAWWRDCLSGTEPVGLPTVVAFGFVRLTTHAQVFARPLRPAEATALVRSWLAQPVAHLLEPSPGHLDEALTLLERLGAAGSLVTDAQIAAFALGHDAILHTADADFRRFPGLRCFNPITGVASRSQRRGNP